MHVLPEYVAGSKAVAVEQLAGLCDRFEVRSDTFVENAGQAKRPVVVSSACVVYLMFSDFGGDPGWTP